MGEKERYTAGLVSIIIPVYNTDQYIENSLKSVLAQTYEDVEIVVVDDGSTDESAEIIDRVLAGIERAQIYHIENHGVSYARNLGLEKAKGEFITFMDSDDIIGTEYIADMVGAAVKHNSELIISGYTMAKLPKENANEKTGCLDAESSKPEIISTVVPQGYEQGKNEAWAYRICACWGRLYRHEVWDRYHVRYEEGVRGEDVPIALFMNATCKNIHTLEKADYFYIQHDGSAMANFRGLKKYNLPYKSMEKLFECAQQCVEEHVTGGDEGAWVNLSAQFYEYGYLRAITQFIFDLGRGASKDKLHELCDWTYDFIAKYMPGYSRNEILRDGNRFSGEAGFTLFQRISVRIMVMLAKCRMLYPVARLLK